MHTDTGSRASLHIPRTSASRRRNPSIAPAIRTRRPTYSGQTPACRTASAGYGGVRPARRDTRYAFTQSGPARFDGAACGVAHALGHAGRTREADAALLRLAQGAVEDPSDIDGVVDAQQILVGHRARD